MLKEQREELREYALRNLAHDDLTILKLNEILLRIYNIGYFEGRKDGERMWEQPTQMHLELRKLTVKSSPKNNAYKNTRG